MKHCRHHLPVESNNHLYDHRVTHDYVAWITHSVSVTMVIQKTSFSDFSYIWPVASKSSKIQMLHIYIYNLSHRANNNMYFTSSLLTQFLPAVLS